MYLFLAAMDFIYLLILLSVFIWIFALIDVLKSEFRGQNDKLIWIVVVLFAGFFGAIIYYFIGRNQKIND